MYRGGASIGAYTPSHKIFNSPLIGKVEVGKKIKMSTPHKRRSWHRLCLYILMLMLHIHYTIQDIQYRHTFVQTMILRNNGLKLE